MSVWLRPLLLLGLLSQSVFLHAQTSVNAPAKVLNIRDLNYQLQPRSIAADTWVIEGAVADFSPKNGCNIINTIFLQTQSGFIVVNTGPSYQYGRQQRQAVMSVIPGNPRKDAPLITQVWNLNLHPDYFLGNQAYADSTVSALAGTIAGQQREGGAYTDNLYRLCGDWMKETESTPAKHAIKTGKLIVKGLTVPEHQLELLRLEGHTSDDLVVLDHTTGIVLVGGIVFTARAPTTPHADVVKWLHSLDVLEARLKDFPLRALVPSHGPVRADLQGIEDTRRYLQWLDKRFKTSAEKGMDISEVLAMPIPAEIASLYAAIETEYPRNVTHLYPSYEKNVFH